MKRILTFILAAILTVSMTAGCTGKGSGNTKTEKTASPDVKSLEPVKFSLFIDHSWFWINSFGGRTVDDEITRKTGVSFDVTKAADANQLQVLIGSGSYPDLVYTGTTSLWPKLANSNVSYDWGSLIQKYAPDFPLTDIEKSNATQPDGKFYTIYNAYSPPEVWKSEPRMLPSNGTATMHVRQDIMEALGNPKLETLDDLDKILAMVKEKYPDMDGMLLGENLYGLGYFKYLFAVPTGNTRLYYDKAASKVKYLVESPEYKDTLAYLNKLYRKGYIKPESLIYQVEQYRQKVYSGKAFAYVRSVTESAGANSAFEKAGLKYKSVTVEKPLSSKTLVINDGIGWSGTYITKSCKKPDRAIQFLSFMKSKEGQRLAEFGIEGVTYKMGSDGYPTLTDEVLKAKTTNYNDMVAKYGIACWNFGVSAATEAIFNYNPSDTGVLNALKNIGARIEFNPWFQFVLPPSGSDEFDIYTKMGAYVDKENFKIIAAESEGAFNSSYDAMVKTCKDMGLDKFSTYVNKKYPDVIKNYK